MKTMTGAEAALTVAAAGGVDICFANPGTTELPVVKALDRVPAIRPVLCLEEAVCTGAADGYARISGRPAMTLLHLGPGLANGLAYLHNARRAGSRVVNLIGDHASWHLPVDPPLTSDIERLAGPMSVAVRRADSGLSLAEGMAWSVADSAAGPTCLIAPADHQMEEVSVSTPTVGGGTPSKVSDDKVQAAAKLLRTAGNVILFLGGSALSTDGLRAAGRIAVATGCTLLQETLPALCERGPGLPDPGRLPYFYDQAQKVLADADAVILVGAREPVSFFGYQGRASSFVRQDASLVELGKAPQDGMVDLVEALDRLGQEVGAGSGISMPPRSGTAVTPNGALTPESFPWAVVAAQPEHCIVVDESVTTGFGYHAAASHAPAHTYVFPQVGGAIGHGLPVATGAAFAAPDRPVILLEADGSGMYTLQALWTQARYGLHVTTVICANRQYRILQGELRADGTNSSAAAELLNLDRPTLDWVKLSEGMGVPAERVTTVDELSRAIARGVANRGPYLVEALITA